MHTAIGRSKEQVADFAMGRYVMRIFAALLGALLLVAVLVLLGLCRRLPIHRSGDPASGSAA